ncbi:MAG: beta-lactamase domain protein [Gemmatimonadetes bacterium]|nr:beta-lactamase domain protein [Gemmatimonadota bacterium]
MLLRRFYDESLAQASYLIGCQATGDAIVIDPNRNAEQYEKVAREEGLRITQVSETHIHADYVSGSRELARRTGARLLLSGEGGVDWQYAFAKEDGATLLHDGDEIRVGNIELRVMHTPGHTPEHIVFVVTDTAAADGPMGMVSGDFLFVGDVGRPDLLERAVRQEGTMELAAGQLFDSLQKLGDLPDWLQVWPGHGAGSACGKALGAVPQSTLGYERRFSPALKARERSLFVSTILAGQPEPPKYFAVMKRLNREGPPIRPASVERTLYDLARLDAAVAAGAQLVDVRAAADFAKAHVPGSLNIPLGRSFIGWAGALLDYARPIILLASDIGPAYGARHQLALIGLDQVDGISSASAILESWIAAGRAVGTVKSTDAASLAATSTGDRPRVIDVRAASEWQQGHLPGATHMVLGELAELSATLPHDAPIVVQCAGGSRSAIAASLLQAKGFTNVTNLAGGLGAWRKAGFPVEG